MSSSDPGYKPISRMELQRLLEMAVKAFVARPEDDGIDDDELDYMDAKKC